MEPAVTPSLAYRDPKAAIRWLQNAFGLEIAVLLTDATGEVAHAAMAHGAAEIGIMREWGSAALLGPAQMKSPASLGGVGTAFLRLSVCDIDAHCAQARAAGARIVQEPADQPYGDRTYRALDLEGHVWNFREPVAVVDDVETKMGLTDRTRDFT